MQLAIMRILDRRVNLSTMSPLNINILYAEIYHKYYGTFLKPLNGNILYDIIICYGNKFVNCHGQGKSSLSSTGFVCARSKIYRLQE
jgi:hypothetical protein